jgi:hypothetical protein
MSMATEVAADTPIAVGETVNPNGISAGDKMFAWVETNATFQAWSHATGTDWGALPEGTNDGVAVSAPATTHFARGGAFWLVRTDPGDCVYLVGRFTGGGYSAALAGGTTNAPGFTMVANPTMADVNLNALAFVDGSGAAAAPAAEDRIVVQDAAGFQKFYVRDGANAEWGRWVPRKSGGQVSQTWEAGATVPAGTGFWYVRTAETPLSIRFGSEE